MKIEEWLQEYWRLKDQHAREKIEEYRKERQSLGLDRRDYGEFEDAPYNCS